MRKGNPFKTASPLVLQIRVGPRVPAQRAIS